jgi:hypothetical protein
VGRRTPLAEGLIATFTPATKGARAEEFELHLSTSSSFTPSSTTFRARGKLTRFEVSGLLSGTTYYVQIVPRDAKGNRGTASAEVSTTVNYVPTTEFILNGSFENWGGGSGVVPDYWSMVTGTWGTNIQRTTTRRDGAFGITFPSSANAYEMQGTPVPASPDTAYEVVFPAKRGTGSPTGGTVLVTLYVDWMSDTSTVISTDTYDKLEDGTTDWDDWGTVGTPVMSPGTTAYVRVRVKKQSTATFSTFVDGLSIHRA